MISFVDPADGEQFECELPPVTFEITDNPIIGELLGPTGDRLFLVCERSHVPFGFRSQS